MSPFYEYINILHNINPKALDTCLYTFKSVILESIKIKIFSKVFWLFPRRSENDTFESAILESAILESAILESVSISGQTQSTTFTIFVSVVIL